jgi:hypothetical protein
MTRTSPQLTDQEDACQPDPSGILRPAADVSFSLLDGQPILFSESAQKIYGLNQTAAYIWCSLLDRRPMETIQADIAKSGLGRSAARDYVREALRNWFKLGLLQPDWELRDTQTFSFSASLGKLTVRIHASSEQLIQLLIPLFNQSISATDSIDETFTMTEFEGLVDVFHDKACILRCATDELAPAFKAYLTEQIVLRCSPDVAFHAACLLSGGKALLVSGPPGEGKSTLTLHLMDAGFEYCSDDIVLIAPDGSAAGVPFAPTLKSGSWTMIKKFRPDLEDCHVHNRPDGKRVRYLKEPHVASSGSFPVGWIVFIKRVANTPMKLTPLGQIETMGRLIDGSCSSDGKMSNQAFNAVKRTLAGAKSFELQYSDAAQARNTLLELCSG